LAPVNVDNSATALLLLRDNVFELVTLDIDMPGMSGFDLCKQMRTMENQKQTPVIFVTGQGDFQSWTQSALSGGNDFIAKPFLFMELTLKALIHILRRRLTKSQSKPAA
jgi:DNA-binding response OmpR family regulator